MLLQASVLLRSFQFLVTLTFVSLSSFFQLQTLSCSHHQHNNDIRADAKGCLLRSKRRRSPWLGFTSQLLLVVFVDSVAVSQKNSSISTSLIYLNCIIKLFSLLHFLHLTNLHDMLWVVLWRQALDLLHTKKSFDKNHWY